MLVTVWLIKTKPKLAFLIYEIRNVEVTCRYMQLCRYSYDSTCFPKNDQHLISPDNIIFLLSIIEKQKTLFMFP